mgnify:CR=1 FL=1
MVEQWTRLHLSESNQITAIVGQPVCPNMHRFGSVPFHSIRTDRIGGERSCIDFDDDRTTIQSVLATQAGFGLEAM